MKKPILNFLHRFILQRLLKHTFLLRRIAACITCRRTVHAPAAPAAPAIPAPLAGSVIDARKHNVIKYSLYARYVNDCKLGAELTSDYRAFLLNNASRSLK